MGKKATSAFFLFVLCLGISALISCASTGRKATYNFENMGNDTYKVSTPGEYFGKSLSFLDQRTVLFDNKQYTFHLSRDEEWANISLTLPSGKVYFESLRYGRFSAGGGNATIDLIKDDEFVKDAIFDIKLSTLSIPINYGKIFGAILIFLIGIFNIFLPAVAWFLSKGWYYKDADPSDFALVFHRVIGVVLCVYALFFAFS